MTRAVSILAGILAMLIGLVALAIILVWTTPIGMPLFDRVSRPIITSAVESSLGSEVTYGELAGDFPNTLVLSDVVLRQNGEIWLRVDQLSLVWRPLAFMGGEVSVESIALDTGALYALPKLPEQAEDQTEDGGGSLPDIAIESLVIDDFTVAEAVVGTEATLNAAGSLRYRDPQARIDLRLWTEERSDEITAEGVIGQDSVDVTLDVRGREDGLLARLAGAEGNVGFYGHAEGPYEDLRAAIAGDVGRYGAVRGELSGNARQVRSVTANISYEPGSFLPKNVQAALGDAVDLDADVTYADDELSAVVRNFSGAFGRIQGDVSGSLGEDPAGEVALSGELREEALAPYGAEALAGEFRLVGSGGEAGDGYAFEGRLRAGDLNLSVSDATNTPAVPFEGDVALDVAGLEIGPANLAPLIGRQILARASVRYTENGALTVRSLSASAGTTSGPYVTVGGGGSYGSADAAVAADVTVRANPAAIALFAPDVTAAGDVSLNADISGTTENLAVQAQADLPSGTFDGEAFPAGSVTADLRGLPKAPSGRVSLTSEEGTYEGQAEFETAGQVLSIKTFDIEAGPLDAEGEGQIHLDTLAGNLTLNADLGRESTILTGQTVGGTLSLQASFEENGGPVDLNIEA
ncbi:MAG: hypothetical protein V2I43_15360, partial [Parvularcula sp.]|nr:hypothetical protein [Parvularcula sp.]